MSYTSLPLPYQANSSHYFSLIADQPGAVLLDSGFPECQLGRYDICSALPEASLQLQPQQKLNELLQQARQLLPRAANQSQLPFNSGLIGYIGYSAAVPNSRHQPQLPGAQIGLYLWALVTDHQQCSSQLVFHPELPAAKRQQLIELFTTNQTAPEQQFKLNAGFSADISREQYLVAFEQIQQHIQRDDCQQINFAQKFSTSYQGSSWAAYQSLRRACPTPYASYFNLGAGSALLSASPEQFLAVQQANVETWPIKGTRPRSQDRLEDQRLANELSNSAKDRNENLMIVQLMREEFAACCAADSIHTPALCQLTSFANVHHLLSCIRGKLQPQQDALDALNACFPPGSISGTPKAAAINIIDQLENSSRELYCGSVFYLDAGGNLDSSVCIRSLTAHQGQLSCWGGGGITSASCAQAEYQESIDKVKVLLQALEQQL